MNMYLLAKKIHRIVMWSTIVLGTIQMATGMNMTYGWINDVRLLQLHATNGLWFSISLGLSMLTGLMMYLVLKMPKKNPVTDGG